MLKLLAIWIILIACTCRTYAETDFVVSYIQDDTVTYNRDLLALALEKTRATYGDFTLSPVTGVMTPRRGLATLIKNEQPNLVLVLSYADRYRPPENLAFIDFPVDLGILGWRICFVSPGVKEKIKSSKTLDDMRQYSIVQGLNWKDGNILRENGFRVIELPSYPALFKMVASERADLFCRGVNELPAEYEKFKDMGNLYYDTSFALHYKMPLFFHLHNSNTLAKKRITDGLKIAYKDGSLLRLWLEKYKASIAFSNLKQRKIFYLKNSAADNTPNHYEQYLIDPRTLY